MSRHSHIQGFRNHHLHLYEFLNKVHKDLQAQPVNQMLALVYALLALAIVVAFAAAYADQVEREVVNTRTAHWHQGIDQGTIGAEWLQNNQHRGRHS